jgi:hypothetical protein
MTTLLSTVANIQCNAMLKDQNSNVMKPGQGMIMNASMHATVTPKPETHNEPLNQNATTMTTLIAREHRLPGTYS